MQSSDLATPQEVEKSSAYTVSRKAKGKTSGFCTGGCGWVSILDNGRCPACNALILKKIRYAEYAKTFEEILAYYGSEFGMLSPPARANLTVPVSMAGSVYFVPVQMFLEFDKIRTGNEGRHKMFFQNIMVACKAAR